MGGKNNLQRPNNRAVLLLTAFILSNVFTAFLSSYICLQNIKLQVNDAYSKGVEECLSASSTFYAEILEVADNFILVEGCNLNSINKQGVYEFAIGDTTIIKYNTTKLNTEFAISKLCKGCDIIC